MTTNNWEDADRVCGTKQFPDGEKLEMEAEVVNIQDLFSSQREEIIREVRNYLRTQKESMGKPKVLDIQREAQMQVLEDFVIPIVKKVGEGK